LVQKLSVPKVKVRVRGRKKRVTALAVRNALPTQCSMRTVRRAMQGLDVNRRRKRSEATPLSQEQESRMNRSRNLQGW
jgi:hypothetical protein